MIDAACAAWTDTKRGDASLPIAADNDTVHALNDAPAPTLLGG